MWQASHNGDHVAQGQNFARLSNYEDWHAFLPII
jgi:hypothetical protein